MNIDKELISKAKNISGLNDDSKAVEACLIELFSSLEKNTQSSISSSDSINRFSETLKKPAT